MKRIILLFCSIYTISCIGQTGQLNLMPWPQEINLGISNFKIDENFTIGVNNNANKRVKNATTKFLRNSF